jgi:hypothetical protein
VSRAMEVYRRFDGASPQSLWDVSLAERDLAAEQASRELNDATQALFRKWEQENGFVEGAGQILLPAGWRTQ